MKFKSVFITLLILLGLGSAVGQSDETSTHIATSAELSSKSIVFYHIDAPPHLSSTHIVEVYFGPNPGATSVTITPCMRGGTCGSSISQTGTSSVVLSIEGLWDNYVVRTSWTNAEALVRINITGTHSLLSRGTGGSSTTSISNETPTGSIDGTNVTYNLVHIPSPATSLKLYRNGLRLILNSDYTISGNTITMLYVLPSGDNLLADYDY